MSELRVDKIVNSSGSGSVEFTNGINVQSVEIDSYFSTSSNPATVNLYGSRGTESSPSIVNYEDQVGSIKCYGYNGTSFSEIGNIKFNCDGVPTAGTPTSGNVPGQYQLSLRDDTNTVVPRHRIDLYGANAFYADDSVIFSKTNNSAGTSVATFVGQHSSTGFASGTNSCLIYSNGNIYNTNNVYSVISDIKLKENIAPATSQWNDIKNLRVVNFNFKEETGQKTSKQIGLIAQEVEKVSPGLVETIDNFYDEPMKGVKTSVINIKVLKALQEAMQRIEELEERLNAAGIPLN
jgi:hypothetical protein